VDGIEHKTRKKYIAYGGNPHPFVTSILWQIEHKLTSFIHHAAALYSAEL